MNILSFLYFLYDILVPRFITEWVVVEVEEDEESIRWTPLHPLAWHSVEDDGEPELIAEVSCFTWLGMAIFPRAVDDSLYAWADNKDDPVLAKEIGKHYE